MFLIAVVMLVTNVIASSHRSYILDEYLGKPEPDYSYFDTGERLTGLFGTTIHGLNVTSLRWLDQTHLASHIGRIWTHQVALTFPPKLTNSTKAMLLIQGSCNASPKPLQLTEEFLALADILAFSTNTIVAVVYQVPNCPVQFTSDPSNLSREEDALIAWSWKQFIVHQDPLMLPRFPMTKASMQAMRAVEEYIARTKGVTISSWTVSGASKRGWTTYLVGAGRCDGCPKVKTIFPLVPIVPSLVKEVHEQYQAYGGFTFAFNDYKNAGILNAIDGKVFKVGLDLVDPINYASRLGEINKFIVLTSDDEFMQFEWSNLWYDSLQGHKHLLILANAEHSMITGIPALIPAMIAMITSPHPSVSPMRHTYYPTNGSLRLVIKRQEKVQVSLRYAITMQSKRRDFRWVRLADNDTSLCVFPEVKLQKPVFGGGNCLQPILWRERVIVGVANGGEMVYEAMPPRGREGRWTGYYMQVLWKNGLQQTTPGYVWPDTLPFKDCKGMTCKDTLV